MNVPVGLLKLLNWDRLLLGPLATDHAPVPEDGVLPESDLFPELQIVPAEPFVAVVGEATTVIVASAVEAVQGELLMVHLTTYEPAPPAGVNVAVGLVKLLNCDANVLGPLTTDHAPVPTEGVLPESTLFPVTQMLAVEPLVAVVGGAVTVLETVATVFDNPPLVHVTFPE